MCRVAFGKDPTALCLPVSSGCAPVGAPVGVTCWGFGRGAGLPATGLCFRFSVLLAARPGEGGPGWGEPVVEGGWRRPPRDRDL